MKKNIKGILKKNKGFTLVELIVVIAILGILVAVAVPRLIGFQDRARDSADDATIKTIENAVGLAIAYEEIKYSKDPTKVTTISWANSGEGATYNVDNPPSEDDKTKIINAMKSYLGEKPPVSKKGNGFTVTISASGEVTAVQN